MEFQLNEEQVAIHDMATSLFADFTSDEALLAHTESGATVMQAAWDATVETGLDLLFVPEALGGSQLGMQELSLVLQAQGAYLGQVPLWRNQVAIHLLAKSAEYDSLLQSAIADKALFTLSNVSAFESMGIQLELDNAGLLQGKVAAVADVIYSRYALILTTLPANKDGNQQGLAIVDLQAHGVNAVHAEATHGGAISDLQFVDVKPIGMLDAAFVSQLQVLSIACLASLQLGVSQRQLKRTVEYVSERIQFDRAIATFQAVQMTLADCDIAIEALRSCLWQLIYKIDAGESAVSEALATAYHACETGHFVSHKAQHVHGGFGVDISYPIYRFLYWSRDIRANLGGSQSILAELGDWLSTNDTLGWKYDLE